MNILSLNAGSSSLKGMPLILIGNIWAEFVDWARKFMLRPDLSLASQEDLKIPICVNTADEAIALLRQHHAKWVPTKDALILKPRWFGWH